MDLSEYARHDAVGLAELVRARQISARSLAKLALLGVEKVDPRLNAVVEVYRDRLADLGEDAPEGPLGGVPFFTKDLACPERGRLHEMGSRLAQGFVSPHSAYLMERFVAAGLVNLGRTTCPEFGFTYTTESVLTGATCNPWNPERIAGGSSGGSGAIVAAGVVPVAHANDGGGSTRIPASCNGLVGLKCSRGRVSMGPDTSDLTFPLGSDLVVSRSVRDTAAVLDAVHGPGPGEAVGIAPPERPYASELGAPTGTLRIAVSGAGWGGVTLAPDVAQGLAGVARLCEEMGHEIREVGPPFDHDAFNDAFGTLWCTLGAPILDEVAEITGRKVSPDTVEPITLELYEEGKRRPASDLVHALGTMNYITRSLATFFEEFDLLLTPTLAVPPPPLGTHHLARPGVSLEQFMDEASQVIPYTPFANFTGIPAITLPLCASRDGLPIGMHFATRFGDEAALIRVASALEQARPWAERRPQIHVAD
jgi:amidase